MTWLSSAIAVGVAAGSAGRPPDRRLRRALGLPARGRLRDRRGADQPGRAGPAQVPRRPGRPGLPGRARAGRHGRGACRDRAGPGIGSVCPGSSGTRAGRAADMCPGHRARGTKLAVGRTVGGRGKACTGHRPPDRPHLALASQWRAGATGPSARINPAWRSPARLVCDHESGSFPRRCIGGGGGPASRQAGSARRPAAAPAPAGRSARRSAADGRPRTVSCARRAARPCAGCWRPAWPSSTSAGSRPSGWTTSSAGRGPRMARSTCTSRTRTTSSRRC